MARIHSEYDRFLVHLVQHDVPEEVRQLAHLILNDLQFLAEAGTARRARSTRLAPLSVAHLADCAKIGVAFQGRLAFVGVLDCFDRATADSDSPLGG